MKNKIIIKRLIYITIIFSILLNYHKAFAENEIKSIENSSIRTDKIVEVVDLDTLKDSSNNIIKLYGISIECYKTYDEEYKNETTFSQDGYKYGISKPYFNDISVEENYEEGINFLKEKILNKEVTIQVMNNNTYNVSMDGESVNISLVKNGYVPLQKYINDSDFIKAQQEAINEKSGIWKIVISSKVTLPPGKVIFSGFKVFQYFMIVLMVIAFFRFFKKYNMTNMVLFYALAFANTAIVAFYNHSEYLYLLIINICLNIVIAVLCIYILIKNSFWNKKCKPIKVIVNMIFLVIFIILCFGGIYQNYSMNQMREHTVSYSFPDFEKISETPDIPVGEYLSTPEDYNYTFNYIDGKQSSFYNLSIIDSIYFSATTFFTVGYGEITPRGWLRIIAIIEMIIGYFLQVILFSTIVAKVFDNIRMDKPEKEGNKNEENNSKIEKEESPIMKEITIKEEYDKLFPSEKGSEEKSVREKALEHALDIRKFEIELYWKRASYFWTFIGATLAGYCLVLKNATDSSNNDILILLNCLGFAFSISWYLVNRGSKFWQNNWERHVDMLEDEIIGPLYKTAIDINTCNGWKLHEEYGFFSV
ncbi:ion channel [Clostridium beijerinckii]|uniref:RipA family octameric membrane protein n=1 Tax=Clostridium beijerinckii TaxID=1520 RepID=UPI00156D401D|nr:ion channel [Clostridium beijerinckii]NRY14396.1 endonuclease YncB(thermonuclease family) [Clostridium beijerinckii]